jgi:opacity protein-like surface antigen
MKTIIFLIFLFTISLPSILFAESIGGTDTQGKGNLAISLDSSYIYDRELNFQKATGLSATMRDIKISSGHQIVVKPSYGIHKNIDAYLKLGIADYKINADGWSGSSVLVEDKILSSTDFIYGLGLKGKYEFTSNWFIGGDLQYTRSKHRAKIKEIAYSTGKTTPGKFKDATLENWHIAGFIAKKINKFTPYLGIRHSDLIVKLRNPSTSGWSDNHKYDAETNWGFFYGIDYTINKSLSINVENRFQDENAVSFACTYKI